MSRSREVSWHSLIAPSTGLPAIGDDRRGNVVAPRKVNVLEIRGGPTVRASMSAHGARKIALHQVGWQTLTDASGLRSNVDDRVGLFDARERSYQRTARVRGTLPRGCSCRSRSRLRCDNCDRLTALRTLHRVSRWIDRETKKFSRKSPNQVHNPRLRVWHSA